MLIYMQRIQSILFNRKYFTTIQAIEWLDEHKFKHYKIDVTINFIRFRQIDPLILEKEGFRHYHNKYILDKKIMYVIANK